MHRRPGDHARGDRRSRRLAGEGQPAGAGRPGDRPLGDRRPVRPGRRVRAQRRDRIPAQRGALPVPALGPGRVPGLQGGAAGYGHRAPGEHRVPGERRDDPRRRRGSNHCVPRHVCGHRLAHHDGQRPRRARLGRRRHRGRGRDARPVGVDADPARRRVQADRGDPAGRHRHRRRVDRDRDAAQARRRRQVRRVLRRWHGRGAAGQSRHPGQHEPRIRFHRSNFPDRRGDHLVSEVHRAQAGAAGAGRGLRQRAGHVARPRPRAGVLRIPRARPVRRRAVHRGPQAPAGPDRVVRRQVHVPQDHSQLRRRRSRQAAVLEAGRIGRRIVPGQRSGGAGERARRRRARCTRPQHTRRAG